MIQKRRRFLIYAPIFLGLVLAYNNCVIPTRFSALHVTSVGNPMAPVSSEVMDAICSVINRCNPQVTLNQCQAGLLPTPGFATPLGVSPSYNTFSSISQGEQTGVLVGNSFGGSSCYDNINSLSCLNPLVQAAYNQSQANPFSAAPNMIPVASCNQSFAPQVMAQLVQNASGFANTVNQTIALPISSTGSGNLLVFGTTSGLIPQITNISDNAPGGGNIWINANYRSVDGGSQASIWYAKNSLPGATTLTVNWTGSDPGVVNIWLAEFSGMDLTTPLDTGAVANSQSASTTVVAPLVTTSLPYEVVFSIVATSGVTAISAGNFFIAFPKVTGDDLAYEMTSVVGSYGAQWSQPSSQYCSSTVAFRAAQQ